MMFYKSIFPVLFAGIFCLKTNAQNPKHELRAAWVATVENIDWPSKKGLPVAQQKAEFIKLLDMHKSNGLNAVIVQVRPVADAFYPSPYEPWSEYLTGMQGLPPTPYYDPLEFMIAETHKRGMEFHAWFNPYRAVFNTAKSSIAPNHPTKIFKDWFVTYGGGTEAYKKYFDPGNPNGRKFVTDVIRDVVKRYDVDAIHFDDYFYPYRIAGKEFPDQASFNKYGNGLNREDWRRSNCDSIIVMLSQAIKATKPWVKFGISPFGVWRNQDKDPMGSETKAGQTNYDDLYADILLWLKKGWIDYVAPQCYWEIGFSKADYEVLVAWWAAHSYGRHVYIGQGIYRAGSNAAWRNKNELPNQINMLRSYPSQIQGSMFFSSKSFNNNPNGWCDTLKNNYYNTIALPPPMKWIDSVPPPPPLVNKQGNNWVIKNQPESKRLRLFVLYAFSTGSKPNREDAATILQTFDANNPVVIDLDFLKANSNKQLGITAVDWNNNESAFVWLK